MSELNTNEQKIITPSEIDTLFESFIKVCRAEGKAKVTIKNYRTNLELFKKFKPDACLNDLTPSTMANFFCFLQDRERLVGKEMVVRDLKNSSIATVRGKLKVFFEWLRERGYIAIDPFEGIRYPDFGYTDKRAFTKEELDKICLVILRDANWPCDLLRKRNIAMIMFLVLTGVRKGELLGLELADVDLLNNMVRIRGETSKSKRDREIPINSRLVSYIKDYLSERSDYATERFWVSNNDDQGFTEYGLKHFTNLLKVMSGINCHVHRFRHTFAVNYYSESHDLVGLMRLMGHKDAKMTLSYLRSMDDEDLIRQINKMSLAKFR